MTSTWTGADRFGGESHDHDGVHWIDFGGPRDADRIVLVHGLGGSHLDWCRLAPLLIADAHVVALRPRGWDRPKPTRSSATVTSNASVVEDFISHQGGPVTLVGNSMGGLISGLVASRSPELVDKLVLIDPVLPLGLARIDPLVLASFAVYVVPGLGERVMSRRGASVTPARLVQRTLDLCCAHPERIPADIKEVTEALVSERLTEPGLDAAYLKATRSLLRFNANAKRTSRMWGGIVAPTLLIHGEKDRLVNIALARSAVRRNPSWRFDALPDVGHVPQLEVPEQIAERVLGFQA
jgi:pimeloyl-ACP methyl ester carboxylesterase